ncbi:MAG: ABC-2 transporter permease [Ruminococcaceae bacterium]|nr:ABC-2 transporter permease [Oscillospiraceae bacterium]
MKGLLLKDWYMTIKYCRAYLFLTVVFCALSFMSPENLFLVFYPGLLCGMLPVNLLAYDERSKWLQYCDTLPYTRAQIVSGKYLIGLFAQLAILLIMGAVHAIRMSIDGIFYPGEFLSMMMGLLMLSLIASSISLPFMFKLGVEKGRLAYLIMVGVISGGSVVMANILSTKATASTNLASVLPILCLVGASIYALSWYLSVVFFRRREL